MLAVWIPTFGIPVFGLLANVYLRLRCKLPQSAVPDLILAFALIDSLIAMDADHFAKFVQMGWIKDAVPHVYGLTALIGFGLWALAVVDIELKLFEHYKAHGRYLDFRAIRLLFTSLVLATLVVFTSLFPFAYKS